MRSRSIIIVGLSVGITVTMILYSHSIVSLIVPILVPDEGLQYKPRGEESKAEREEKERQAAYAKQQEKLERLLEEKRDSSEICQVHKENLKADRVRIDYGL